jgi:hypothetical protein
VLCVGRRRRRAAPPAAGLLCEHSSRHGRIESGASAGLGFSALTGTGGFDPAIVALDRRI